MHSQSSTFTLLNSLIPPLQLILTVGLTATLTSGQSGWPSGQFPSSQYSQYQPYRAPSAPSAPSTLSIPSSGQYQSSPQLQTLSQLSGYNRLAAPSVQSSPWSPSSAGQSGNRGWSIPSPARAYASLPQPASAGYSGEFKYSGDYPIFTNKSGWPSRDQPMPDP